MRLPSALLALAVVHLASSSSPARACDRLPIPAVAMPTFPEDGAVDVPVNARPLVRAVDSAGFVATRDDLILQQGPDFSVVDVEVDQLFVRGEFGGLHRVIRLTPRAPLEALTLYRIADDDGRVAEFTTGPADQIPAELRAPTVSVTATSPHHPDRTGFDCAFDGQATLVVTPDLDNSGVPLVGVIGLDAAPDVVAAEGEDTPLAGLGAPALSVFGDGPLALEVAMMDATGRTSPTTAVTVDLSEAGCSQAGRDLALVALAPLLLLRRRRR